MRREKDKKEQNYRAFAASGSAQFCAGHFHSESDISSKILYIQATKEIKKTETGQSEKLSVPDREQTYLESSILAQDERWRRA